MATRDKVLSDPRSGARPLGGSAPGNPPPSVPRTQTLPSSSRTSQSGASRTPGRSYRVTGPTRTSVTPRQTVSSVTSRPGALGPKHVLTAEFILGMVIVLIRVVADYEPQSNGTVKGQIAHPKGQFGPIPIAAGLIGTFFFLSFLVAKGGKTATVANTFGALIIIVLAMKSVDEANSVVGTFPSWGKGNLPSGTTASTWDTSSATPAGDPLTADTSTAASGTAGTALNPNASAAPSAAPRGVSAVADKLRSEADLIIGGTQGDISSTGSLIAALVTGNSAAIKSAASKWWTSFKNSFGFR